MPEQKPKVGDVARLEDGTMVCITQTWHETPCVKEDDVTVDLDPGNQVFCTVDKSKIAQIF